MQAAVSAAKTSCLHASEKRNILIAPVTIIYIFVLSLHSQTRLPQCSTLQKDVDNRMAPSLQLSFSKPLFSLPSNCQVQLCVYVKSLSLIIFFFTRRKRFTAVKSYTLWLKSQRENGLSIINCGVLWPPWC